MVLSQVIIHGHHVNALACKRTQIRRHGGNQSLAFTGLHFGNVAAVQGNAAHDLNVEGALTQGSPRGFTHGREGLDEDVVQSFAFFEALLEFVRFTAQFLIAQGFKIFLKSINLGSKPVELTQGTSFSSSKDFVNNGHEGSWDCDRMIRACVAHTVSSLRISDSAFDFFGSAVSFFSVSRSFLFTAMNGHASVSSTDIRQICVQKMLLCTPSGHSDSWKNFCVALSPRSF